MANNLQREPRMRVVICGAGNRAFPKDRKTSLFQGWFETIQRAPGFEVVGVQDPAITSLERVKKDYSLNGIPTFTDLNEALNGTACNAVLVCPATEAHASVALSAIENGCHILIEKPMVARLADAFQISRSAREKGVTVGVVQNWRLKSMGRALREAIQSGKIGQVGNVFFRYVRDREQSHLPSYLFEEPFPLLYAMSIHHFDLFRYVLGENIQMIEGRAFIPPWSRYQSPPCVHLWMTTESGIVISYVGTFSSKNRHIMQESFIIDGSLGTLTNDSQWGDPPLLFSGVNGNGAEDLTAGASLNVREQYDQADYEYLVDFRQAIHSGQFPLCPPEDNVWTLATVEGAVKACETGSPVDIKLLVQESLGSVAD